MEPGGYGTCGGPAGLTWAAAECLQGCRDLWDESYEHLDDLPHELNAKEHTQWLQKLRTPGAIRPNMKVLGPEVQVPADAPLQDHLLGLFGRDAATRRSDAVNRER